MALVDSVGVLPVAGLVLVGQNAMLVAASTISLSAILYGMEVALPKSFPISFLIISWQAWARPETSAPVASQAGLWSHKRRGAWPEQQCGYM